MEELLRQARLVLRGMWLHHWLGLLVAWGVGLAAGIAVFVMPDKYEASARVFVDTDSVLKPLMAGLTIQANTEQQIAMLSRTLISRPNVEKLVRMADLDLGVNSPSQKEALIEKVTKALSIKSVGRDNLYTLGYVDTDPERARKVVQSLTTVFVESSLGDKRSDTDSARKFIDEQISIYQKKLEEAENRLKQFKLQNIEMGLDKDGGAGGRLTDLGAQLAQTRLALRESENSRDAIRKQIAAEQPAFASDSSGSDTGVATPEIDGRIDAQKRNLDAMLQRFTEQHPDVVGARRIIKDLEEQKRKEVEVLKAAATANPAAASFGANPAYQQMKVSLTQAEATVAALRVRVAEYESRYQKALGKIKLLPEVEAEYAQLNRDYDVHKKNYDSLIQRRESASISEGMTDVTSVADFRLIDPPRASRTPVGPNRIVLLSLALLASLVIGLAISFAASQLRPTFFDAHTLREVTGLPLLGTVSKSTSPADRQREKKDLLRFFGGLGLFVVLYGLAIAIAAFIIFRAA
jgi:polysaccharide chain length determinant protein (PEP-CTERM system associated)